MSNDPLGTCGSTSDLVETDAILQAQATEFMVSLANAVYHLFPADRLAVFEAVGCVVAAMDAFPPELQPHLIYTKGGRLVVTFNGDPARAPVVVDLPASDDM